MKRTILALAAMCAASASRADDSPVDFVLPVMGTYGDATLSNGNVYPAISRPWGMNSWTPQTGEMGDKWKYRWIYDYRHDRINGIRLTHQPSPWMGDYGAFAVMPMAGKPEFDLGRRASWYSHKTETVKPHFYRAYLADYDVWFEMAPSCRAAVMRVTYPETDSPLFLLDVTSGAGEKGVVSVDRAARRIAGRIDCANPRSGIADGFALWFVAEFDRDFDLAADVPPEKGAIARFAPVRRGEKVSVRMAASFIGPEQAERNLMEVAGRTVEEVSAEGEREWNELLGRAKVEGGSVDRLRTFYTCLYRSLLFPRIHWEVDADGNAVHRSPVKANAVEKGCYYAGTGFWDTFRSLFPLLNLLYPEANAKMTAGLANCWRECGWMPEWSNPGLAKCMIGNNSASVVADAVMCGLASDEDAAALYDALVHGANAVHPDNPHVGRAGFAEYNSLGYVPRDVGIRESAARTLEYAYDDWCIARLARHLGRPEAEIALYEKRSGNWRNVFNPAVGLMCGRSKDGSFDPDFGKFRWGGDFTEGNSLHYTWSVFHDVPGLMAAMGGREAFARRLDEIFSLPPVVDVGRYGRVIHEMREMQIAGFGQYAHGNQPIQHMIYLYDWAGEPRKAQYWVREAMDRLYRPWPDGYCGDEDNGQTSAWFVWSALGMYPVCPGSGEYALGAPLFEGARLSLPGGKTLGISAPGAAEKRYSSRVALGGRELATPFVRRADLLEGGMMEWTME